MSDLIDFLLDRIGEDEAVARAAQRAGEPHDQRDRAAFTPDMTVEHLIRNAPALVLVDCEARRRIVELGDEAVLRFLALRYADHRGYRQEWQPSAATPG